MLIKQKSLLLQRNLAFKTFGELLLVLKSAIPPLFNNLEMLSSASDKPKLFAEKFSKNSNLVDSGISLPVFPSRTNLKLHTISVTPKMVKKIIMNLDLSKASGLDCIPLVVLKNCVPELSYTLAELFIKCLKESCCVCALAHNALQLPFFFFFFFSGSREDFGQTALRFLANVLL